MDRENFINTREARLLLGDIGMKLPVTYNVKPIANKNMLSIDSKIDYESVIKYFADTLKAKEQNGLYSYNNALLKIHDTNPVTIEIVVGKITEMRFLNFLILN